MISSPPGRDPQASPALPACDPPEDPSAQGADPAKPLEAPLEQAPPADPPAAKIVLTGTRTEREASLERDLKARETRLAELEDENRRLKTPPTARPARSKRHWLEGNTLFDCDE